MNLFLFVLMAYFLSFLGLQKQHAVLRVFVRESEPYICRDAVLVSRKVLDTGYKVASFDIRLPGTSWVVHLCVGDT